MIEGHGHPLVRAEGCTWQSIFWFLEKAKHRSQKKLCFVFLSLFEIF
jgi:hypothetical protein